MDMDLKGKDYWKSLDQLADSEDFKQFLHREFPEGASELNDGMSRRKFFTLMGASLALAGLTSCRRPEEKIVPYVKAPEEIIPGIPLQYATTMPFGTSSYGVLVRSNEGRPTKIEGNPLHPSTMGASNAFVQASLLDLYDPDRAKVVTENGAERSWAAFVQNWREDLAEFQAKKGQGLAILSRPFASPTLSRLKKEFERVFPQAIWATYEPVSNENLVKGIELATGSKGLASYQLDKARIVLSIDSDFLHLEPENIVNARQFADGRLVESTDSEMNRLYVVEPTFSVTGSMADHRLRIRAGEVLDFVLALAEQLQHAGVDLPIQYKPSASHFDQQFLEALALDLAHHKGESLVLAGSLVSPEVHAVVLSINQALGNVGETLTLRHLNNVEPSNMDQVKTLSAKMDRGEVATLYILGGNPLYDLPADLEFDKLLARVEKSIYLGSHENETAVAATWHVPQSHYLESWGDAEAQSGALSVIQPLIQPLFASKSDVELLNLVVTGEDRSGYEIVQDTWKGLLKSNFAKAWREVLHDGVYPLEASKITESINGARVNAALASTKSEQPSKLELVFRPSPSTWDGRYANNGWMMELPHPTTKLAWDNAACFSPKTAGRLGLESGDLIELNLNGRRLQIAAWILPGQAENSISVDLGYGRTRSGRIGQDAGFNAFKLRTFDAMYVGQNVMVTKLHRKYKLANVQDHWSMEGRPIVREASLDEYRDEPHFAEEMVEHPPLKNLWKEHSYEEGYQWGMTIDLNACTGCNACTIACQSENNIPIVGKEQVSLGREMHWIRLDRYFNGDPEDPEMVFQPMACQHCENAPCEQVCPVQATSHSKDGLNVMTYNRCVGTRYCSNNCPYKVRRFNFFNYTKDLPELVQMAQNPDVTVRSRGVMEKCTYCLQRINAARIQSRNEGRPIEDGEVQTACQQACPTRAIRFGDINDKKSDVSTFKGNDRKYDVLAELNVRPRTSYLAKLRNPNPRLVKHSDNTENHHA